jgi:tRNA pseudouridine55 synthase
MIIRAMVRDNDEIILIDKPKGITSFGVIKLLRRKTGVRKMGHAGTLDPLATGLLIIGVGKGTKKLSDLIKLPKTYEASILLGVKTDTADLEGKILEDVKVKELDTNKVKAVVKGLEGKLLLSVPAYSAIKVKGKRLYKLARQGKKTTLPKREMEVKKAVLKKLYKSGDHYILDLKLGVVSGTYIRSIAEEVGKRLGVPATLSDLRRTVIGKYKIKDAEKIN